MDDESPIEQPFRPTESSSVLAERVAALEGMVERLGRVTGILRRWAFVAAIALLVLLVQLLIVIALPSDAYVDESAALLFSMIPVGIALFFALFSFDSARKFGDALSEEVSDEVQRLSKYARRPAFAASITEARLGIRYFLSSSELPLAPTRFGVTIYAVVAIAIGVGAVLAWSGAGY